MTARPPTSERFEGAPPVSLSCSVFGSFDSPDIDGAEWDRFVSSVGGDLYMTFDWCRIWWSHYGPGRSLRILIFKSGSRWVGVVPLFIDTVWLGPVWLRLAKLVGADYSLQQCNPPVAADWAEGVFERVIDTAIRDESCDAICFGPMSGTYRLNSELRKACVQSTTRAVVNRDRAIDVHTAFELPRSFAAYLASLDKRQRGNYKRDLHLLSKALATVSDVVTEPDRAAEEFRRFRALHDRQWTEVGKLGHFGDWPDSAAFNEDLVTALSQAGRFRMYRLLADAQVVSLQYCFLFDGCNYWRLPARIVGDEWNRFGFGRMGLFQIVEKSIQEGAQRIEAGQGHYDYKVQLGGQEHPLRSLLIVAARLSARIRCRLFCLLADGLELFYYRVWFLRVTPRFRWLQRPLWGLWIRSRI